MTVRQVPGWSGEASASRKLTCSSLVRIQSLSWLESTEYWMFGRRRAISRGSAVTLSAGTSLISLETFSPVLMRIQRRSWVRSTPTVKATFSVSS